MVRIFYGPVDSWRFGRSLGVDPLAGREKRCPFSCIYCQYGETRRFVRGRQVFVTRQQLQAEMAALGTVAADCVTFAGLGEPTLAANLPELVQVVRRRFSCPVIILTGSGLICRADVRADLLAFDAVVAKLDAPDEALFRQINRPLRGAPCAWTAIVEGLRHFRRVYEGRLVLQMMFVQANKDAALRIAELARSLHPDEVQLNTPLQPALGGPVSEAEMREIADHMADLPVSCVYRDGQAQVTPRFL